MLYLSNTGLKLNYPFYVVVVLGRQRNLQKRMMHVQRFCFVSVLGVPVPVPVPVAVVVVFSSSSYFRVLSKVFEGQELPPPPNAQLPLQKVLLSLQYISNCIGKSSRHDEVNAHTVIFLKIVSQNAPDCISAVQSFQKNFRGGMPPDPPGKLVVFGHSGLLPQTINPR